MEFKQAQEINEQIRIQNEANPIPYYDEESRRIISAFIYKYLKDVKYVNDTFGSCNYDLLAVLNNGARIAFEVKHRTFNSDAFPSHTMGNGKYQQLAQQRQMGYFNRCMLVTVWNNGCFWISDISDESTLEEHLMNKTTNVSSETDGHKMSKYNRFWSKDKALKYYYCYQVLEDGSNVPVFSKEPINVSELNSEKQTQLF